MSSNRASNNLFLRGGTQAHAFRFVLVISCCIFAVRGIRTKNCQKHGILSLWKSVNLKGHIGYHSGTESRTNAHQSKCLLILDLLLGTKEDVSIWALEILI